MSETPTMYDEITPLTERQYADALSKARADMAAALKIPAEALAGQGFSGEARTLGLFGMLREAAPVGGVTFALAASATGVTGNGSALAFMEAQKRAAQEVAALAALGWANPADVTNLKALSVQTGRPALELARIVTPGTLRRAMADIDGLKAAATGPRAHGAAKSLALSDLRALQKAFQTPAGGSVAGDHYAGSNAKAAGKWRGASHPAARNKRGKRRR